MPRFSRADLATITLAQYNALSPASQAAYDAALIDLWHDNYLAQSLADFAADHKRIGSRESHEWGR